LPPLGNSSGHSLPIGVFLRKRSIFVYFFTERYNACAKLTEWPKNSRTGHFFGLELPKKWRRVRSRRALGGRKVVEKKLKLVKSPGELGQQIRERRKASGMTLQDAAAMANVGVRFLSELERGKATSQLGLTLKILELFGLNLYVEER
jgi:HTH-type transcriptional regulator / antitoxin HipB